MKVFAAGIATEMRHSCQIPACNGCRTRFASKPHEDSASNFSYLPPLKPGSSKVHLPAQPGSRIREGRRDITRRTDMRLVSRLDQEAVVEVGSGTYRFVVVL